MYWAVDENLIGKTVAEDVLDPSGKEVVIRSRKKLTADLIQKLKDLKIEKVALTSKMHDISSSGVPTHWLPIAKYPTIRAPGVK